MKLVNSSRFLLGSANRLNGIQLTRIEPCNIILFTASPKFKRAPQRFTQGGNMYQELFHWDQKLHVLDFFTSKGPSQASELEDLCRITGGTYKLAQNFGDVRFRMQMLAENSLYTVSCNVKVIQNKTITLERQARFFFEIG
jgi:hypothetical protein